jgi:membrane associated rhomboid family serine protease
MIEDRYYMRRPSGNVYRSATFTLIALNVVAFIAEIAFFGWVPAVPHWLALSADGLRHGYLWQLVTFQFLHANLMHLLFNCLAIYIFGNEVEEALGRKSFYALYFSSGIIGGLVQALLGIFLKGIFESAVVGASAGAFGLTAAFALLYPDRLLMLFFIIPLRAKYLLPISVVLALVMMFTPATAGNNVAHAAHLGGMLAGYLYVRYAVHWNLHWPQMGRAKRRPARRLVKVPSHKPSTWREAAVEEEDLPPQEFLSKEVDPILDKISAQGIGSLTDRERKILERARSKVGKR